MSHDDGDWCDFDLKYKADFYNDVKIIENEMLGTKKFIDFCQRELNDPKNKEYKAFYLQTERDISYPLYICGEWWHISSRANGVQKSSSITYGIPICCKEYLTRVCNRFEELRQKGIIQECFAKDFPSVVVFRPEDNYLKLYFSTKNVYVPTTKEYLKKSLDKLDIVDRESFQNVLLYLNNKEKRCPLFKKKQFGAGQKTYDDILRQKPLVIDNNKQNKLKSYNDITELVKGE